MSKQLEFNFNGFAPRLFDEIRDRYNLNYVANLEEKIKHLQYSVRTYKGHKTKRKKK